MTPERWRDFETLFGSRGACGGCWCMTPRLSSRDYAQHKGDGNRRLMKALVDSGRVPGLLAYRGKKAIGWCSIEPRESLIRLQSSRVLKPVDARPVWSIVCFFVAREERGGGVSRALIDGALEWARARGASTVEAYPIDPGTSSVPAVFAWTGLLSAFRKAGFREVARRSETRPVMRFELPAVTGGRRPQRR